MKISTVIFTGDVFNVPSLKKWTKLFDDAIFLIEWAEKIKVILPNNCLNLLIKNNKNNNFLEIEGDESWKKRFKNIKNYEKY